MGMLKLSAKLLIRFDDISMIEFDYPGDNSPVTITLRCGFKSKADIS